ncbi:hypothetical protein CNYM01_13843 [Colletotrichum nymphaeae SA-01]|uniref:Uncharacterized protein n=1 Tax=Colletotrichum nymphaeae SA-01 TaxID=1460502 RepID=A0A135UN30_9PEZI|nr:hypothetical protein CNYM01_13843 [Colletotrichum nymphaeae SA-01]
MVEMRFACVLAQGGAGPSSTVAYLFETSPFQAAGCWHAGWRARQDEALALPLQPIDELSACHRCLSSVSALQIPPYATIRTHADISDNPRLLAQPLPASVARQSGDSEASRLQSHESQRKNACSGTVPSRQHAVAWCSLKSALPYSRTGCAMYASRSAAATSLPIPGSSARTTGA